MLPVLTYFVSIGASFHDNVKSVVGTTDASPITATFPGAKTITVYRDGEKTEIAGETLDLTLASRGGAFVTVAY